MSKPNTIKIDDVEYVRADNQKIYEGEIKIAVLDRNYIYVGRVELKDDFIIIRNAKNIRIWGTSKGLGELVHGPTSKTILDDVGTIHVPIRALVHFICVEQSKWKCI